MYKIFENFRAPYLNILENGWNGKYLVEGVKYMRLWKSWKEMSFKVKHMEGLPNDKCQSYKNHKFYIWLSKQFNSHLEKPVKTSVKMKHIYWLIKSWIFWNVKDEKWSNVIDSKQVTWNGSLYYHLVKKPV